jgi:type III secretion protein J
MHCRLLRALRIAGSLGCLVLAGCKEELYSGLPQQEANKMMAVLLQRGIDVEKRPAKDGSETISIDRARFVEAMTALTGSGYPHKNFESMGDVFKSGGLVPSPIEERARLLYAIDQELSATISQIDGVLSARVEVVLPENDLLARNPTPSSASVFVRYKEDSGVDRLVPQLKTLVANSVQGLAYDRVSVVLIAVAPQVAPPSAPVAPVDLRALALAALAGALAVFGVGAIGFRLQPRLRRLLAFRRQDSAAALPVDDLVRRLS